jgi:S1-C subfamily serine protease
MPDPNRPGGEEEIPEHISFAPLDAERDPVASAHDPDQDPRFDEPDAAQVYAAPRPEPEPPRTRRGIASLLLAALFAGIVGAALAAGAVYWIMSDDDTAAAPPVTVVERVETEIVPAEAPSGTASAVARRVLPSIVTVEISQSGGDFVPSGSGSGVVLESDGLLVTNQHVVDGAATVRVVFADGRTYPAEVIGGDTLTDIAVIEIDAVGLTPITLGSSEGLDIGDTAIAVGSPLGLDGGPSVTVGVVSAFDRRVRTAVDSQLFGMLQTDAPITRGSSGGALVDGEGSLIGITTAIAVSDVGAEGLGFAIPVELVTRITSDLVADGEVRHAFLGITGSTYFDEQPDGATVPSGVLVEGTIDGTAADAAGIEAGDIIRSFDGEPVVTMEQLVVELRFNRVGDVVEVLLTRNGEDETIELTLMERPEGV